MKTRILAALVALFVVPFASYGADEENPFKKVKVGDYAIYISSMKTGGEAVAGTPVITTVTVSAKNDKEATLRIFRKLPDNSIKLPPREEKIDLTKPFHPTKISGLLLIVWQGDGVPKIEKIKSGEEKLKAGGKEYSCIWETYKITRKAPFNDVRKETLDEVEIKGWQTKEFAIKMLKTQIIYPGNPKSEVTFELTESGNKKSD